MRASTPASYCDVDSASLGRPSGPLGGVQGGIARALRQQAWLDGEGAGSPVIHAVFKAEDAAQAHAVMESNQHIGKIVFYLVTETR